MAKLQMEDSEKGGNIYFDGKPEELTMMIVGAMQTEDFLAELFKRAVQVYGIAKKQGLNITNNKKLFIDDDAEKKYEEIFKNKK